MLVAQCRHRFAAADTWRGSRQRTRFQPLSRADRVGAGRPSLIQTGGLVLVKK